MHFEKLIELVRNYSYLYDQQDKRYSDNDKKVAAWEEIGRALNEDAKECKKQWNSLRDRYRRCLKNRRETESGQAANKRKKWIYEDEMQFLVPHFREKETMTFIENNNESNDEVKNVSEQDISQGCISEDSNYLQNSQGSASSVVCDASRKTLLTSKKKEPEAASSELMNYILSNRNDTVNMDEPDDIDFFFKSVALSVKKLSLRNQVIVKARISSILSELQLEELSGTSYE